MARIPKAQYETMPSYAKQMRSAGQELNQALIEAYTNIANMHSVWYGKRYNSLLQQFNNMIPQMSELLEFVVAQLPFALETIANNYSSADGVGKITSATRTEPKKINAITKVKHKSTVSSALIIVVEFSISFKIANAVAT